MLSAAGSKNMSVFVANEVARSGTNVVAGTNERTNERTKGQTSKRKKVKGKKRKEGRVKR